MKYKEFIITFTEFPLKHIKHIFFGRWNFEFKTKRNWDFLGKKGIFNLRFNIRVISLYPHSILDHFLGSIAKIKFFKIQNRKNGGNPKNGESNSFLKNLYYLKARNQLQNKCVFPKIFPQSIFIIFIIGGAILINNSTNLKQRKTWLVMIVTPRKNHQLHNAISRLYARVTLCKKIISIKLKNIHSGPIPSILSATVISCKKSEKFNALISNKTWKTLPWAPLDLKKLRNKS